MYVLKFIKLMENTAMKATKIKLYVTPTHCVMYFINKPKTTNRQKKNNEHKRHQLNTKLKTYRFVEHTGLSFFIFTIGTIYKTIT